MTLKELIIMLVLSNVLFLFRFYVLRVHKEKKFIIGALILLNVSLIVLFLILKYK